MSASWLEMLLKEAKVIPAVNQIERHPYAPQFFYMTCMCIHSDYLPFCRSCLQDEIVEACTKHGIVITSFSPLGSDNSPLMTNPIVTRIAEKHGVSPANVLISLQANTSNVNGDLFSHASCLQTDS